MLKLHVRLSVENRTLRDPHSDGTDIRQPRTVGRLECTKRRRTKVTCQEILLYSLIPRRDLCWLRLERPESPAGLKTRLPLKEEFNAERTG
jgi:hypothetical protein